MTRTRNRLSFSGWAGLAALAGVLGLAGLTATPAGAEVFHVKMRNGSTIDTLYKPQQATFDPNVVILLSDAGNWIGVNQREIENVISDSEIHGFGVALNFNTIAIGWAPNDLPEPTAQGAAQAATQQALQNLYKQQQAQEHYTVPQFVNTDQTAGIPSRLVGGGVLPGVPAQVPQLVPMPAAAPAPGGANPQQ